MIEISDASFDLSQTQNYTLSIRFFPSGFCFAITDREKRLIHYTYSEEGFPKDSVALCQSFGQVYFCSDAFSYTLLPQSVFKTEWQEEYWKLNFGPLQSQLTLLHDSVRLSDIVNLYACDLSNAVFHLLKEKYPAMQVIHRQTVQMCIAIMRNKQANRKQLFLTILDGAFDALLLEKGKVIFTNTFSYQKEDEFLYYVLNIFDQFKLDQYQSEVIINGSTTGKEAGLLSTYIKTITESSLLQRELNGVFTKSNSSLFVQQSPLLNLPFAIN